MTLACVHDKVYRHGQTVAVDNAKTGEFSVIFCPFYGNYSEYCRKLPNFCTGKYALHRVLPVRASSEQTAVAVLHSTILYGACSSAARASLHGLIFCVFQQQVEQSTNMLFQIQGYLLWDNVTLDILSTS